MGATGRFAFFDFEPDQEDVAAEVLLGLQQSPKSISPKYFYDQTGSELFEKITQLKEYYLTRTELALLDQYLPEVVQYIGTRVCVIEYGSGSTLKIRKVLEVLRPQAYVPIDISAEHLKEQARALHADFPTLDVLPVCADLTQAFDLPSETQGLERVGFFPGSSIGNFTPSFAQEFLANVRLTLGAGSALLIGVDRKKDREIMEAAYNDAEGITAAFNRNLLHHLNAVLGTDFNVAQFNHVARYNEILGCIQMF